MPPTTDDPSRRPTRALLPAAGSGRRARPLTRRTPKCLLEVDGEALLARAIRTARDQLGITDVVVITGENDERVRDALSGYPGVSLSFVRCEDPSIGLARGMLLAEHLLDGPFVTLLPDEVYVGANHVEPPALAPDAWPSAARSRTRTSAHRAQLRPRRRGRPRKPASTRKLPPRAGVARMRHQIFAPDLRRDPAGRDQRHPRGARRRPRPGGPRRRARRSLRAERRLREREYARGVASRHRPRAQPGPPSTSVTSRR